MSTAYSICPTNHAQWNDQADANGVVSLHDEDGYSSASRLPLKQFLAMKVIWNFERNINVLRREKWAQRMGTNAKDIETACTELKKEDAWSEYLEALPKNLPPNFDFTRKH